jgi:ribose 5-phosphate isomerase A
MIKHKSLSRRIADLGASVVLRRDETGRPFITDEGHHILDCSFERISDPSGLAGKLDRMPGVVGHGLFLGLADVALIGKDVEIHRNRRSSRKPI